MSGRIVVLGSLHLDIMVAAPSLPRLGETMAGHAWGQKPGGKGGNQAVAAARHGAAVAMVGAVGNDAFGPPLLAHLRANDVNVDHVVVQPEPTGMSVAISEASGDYAAVIVSGVNLTLGPPRITAAGDLIAHAQWLVLQNEVPESANLAAALAARAAGCSVMLNAAPACTLPAELAALLDILVVNALEAEALAGVPVTDAHGAAQAATALLKLVPCAVVTAGGNGVAVATRDGHRQQLPALKIDVISTHGAGDTFVGALAARLADGAPLDEALRYANTAAALLVSTPPDAQADIGSAAVAARLAANSV